MLYDELSRFRVDQRSIVVSSNLIIGRRGLPLKPNGRGPEDPGVAAWFYRLSFVDGHYKKKLFCIACDAYDDVTSNMRALGKTIEALRGIQRWGSTLLLERAFSGFEHQALPEPDESDESEQEQRKKKRGKKRRRPKPNFDAYQIADEAEVPEPEEEIDEDDVPNVIDIDGPWYEVLGFWSIPDSLEDADANYRKLIGYYHPDRPTGDIDIAAAVLNARREAKAYFSHQRA